MADKKRVVNLKVYGDEKQITQFLEFCKKMEYMGNIGSSRVVPVYVDGDGRGRLRFDFGNFKAEIDKQKFQKEIHKNGRNVEQIYIG